MAGTKDFPQDHLDDLTLPFGNTLNLTKRGRDVEGYYRKHMTEIDTLVAHSMGGNVALALEEKYRDKIGSPGVGIKQVKTFGALVVAGNIGGNNQKIILPGEPHMRKRNLKHGTLIKGRMDQS